jgi:transposase
MTVPLDVQQDIREMDARGIPRAEISRRLGVSRNTVARYADMEDMSPAAPVAAAHPRPATDAYAAWIGAVLEADLGAPRKQRHTAKRIYDRMVAELGYEGSYSSVCRRVASWRREHAPASPRDGYLELEWAPGTAQVDFGNFSCVLAGERRRMKLLVVTLPHSNARYCEAMLSERSECMCAGLAHVFELIGRAPATLVLDNATEAGRMVRGKVTESELFSRFRAHYRCASRYCNPYSGNEKGSVENAVGFLRRNLLVPEPSASSLGELNALLAAGCERINAASRCRDGRPTPEALAEDLSAMLALPGVPFDAVRWVGARADKRGYVEACGNRYCAGPAWHGRELLVGLRADSVEILADRGRLVARLPRSWGEGETVRNPASLIPALVARPRAFGESTVRRDMPAALVAAIDRCGKADRRRALRAIARASERSGFPAACAAAERIFAAGRVPDDASCDLLARRASGGGAAAGSADLSVYDRLAGEAVRDAG